MSIQPKINYQKQLDDLIKGIDTKYAPTLFLHSCCAPCSSYVLEYLSGIFKITVFYYNPNIYPAEEYYKRVDEQKKFIAKLNVKNKIDFIEGDYVQQDFYACIKGLENIPEGGERCFACYKLRLEETARLASELGFDYFTTTLSISPYKNALKLNEISAQLSKIYDVKNLPSDFKKKNGYKRSIELSENYGLYRQDYCGCVFSKNERENHNESK